MVSKRLAPVSVLIVLLLLSFSPLAALAQGSLDEEYVSLSGSLSFSYPEGWTVLEEGGQIYAHQRCRGPKPMSRTRLWSP